MMTQHFDHLVDARQQSCPMPILKLKRALKDQTRGQIFLVKSTDPNSQQDLIYFCRVQGLQIVHYQQEANEFHYYVEN